MMFLAWGLRWLRGVLAFTQWTMSRWSLAFKLAIGRFLKLLLKFSQGTFLHLGFKSQGVASYHLLLQYFLSFCFVGADYARRGIVGHRTWNRGRNCRS